jgi:peptidoglycan hydrolase-like protein with peptidoglycan-binding domain
VTVLARRIVSLVISIALLVAGGALGYWAATTAIVPPALPVIAHAAPTYTVEVGHVGRSLRVSVSAGWESSGSLFSGRNGTLTSIVQKPGALAQSGNVIVTIDLEPLVVASGDVPMFRSLKRGVTGPDVAQLQALLRDLRYLRAPANLEFDRATETAVKSWQRAIGAAQDGIVEPGSLLFVPSLPKRMEVSVTVGQRVGTDTELVRILAPVPKFASIVTASERAELTSGTIVSIDAPDAGTWKGTVGAFTPLEDGRFSAEIDGTLCGSDCDVLPLSGQTALIGSVELVADTTGPVVPISALVQQPSGGLAVTLANGTRRSVTVVAEADGFAVIAGLTTGTVIQLPAPPGS